jgi:hypothetical protein
MKSIGKSSSWRGSILAVLALASVCWLLPGKAAPQEQRHEKAKPVPQKQTPPSEQVKVFNLAHASAGELAGVLRQLLGNPDTNDYRIAVVARSNSLIVAAHPEVMAQIEAILSKLDVASVSNAPESEVFSLHFTRADNNLLQALQQAIPSGAVSVDATRNKVVASGNSATLLAVRRLLKQLDEPAQQPANADMQVRIVWLASGVADKELPKPPADLKDVVAELSKLGVEDPRLITQTIVTAQFGKKFQVQGLAQLDPSYKLSIQGMLTENLVRLQASKLQVSIDISAAQATAPTVTGRPSGQISGLNTEITAPVGHAVVLGMTPNATSTSVFVVQILPKK